MHKPSSLPFLLLVLVVASTRPVSAAGAFVNFEAKQTRPLCLSPDGTKLFAVNTPDARLSVWDVSQPSNPFLLAEIPVGLEPVSVNARDNNEVWVVNEVSDSVSIVSVSNGIAVAEYEYGPFHELLRATGPLARLNPFLAATKFYDLETGLYCYGYRYYDPSTGRWPNRDPIEEQGGRNLYAFLDNDSVNWVDILGLVKQHHRPDGGLILEVEKCEIVFYFGHGNPKHSPDFLFPSVKARGGCPYAGGAVACFADNINTRITKHRGILIPGSPTASTDPIWTGNVDPLRQNTEIDAAFQSMRAGVVQLVNDWLKNKKSCCPSVKVTFIGYDNKPKVQTFTTPITGYDPSK